MTCSVEDPIFVSRKINGITYRYFSNERPQPMPVACELALALHETGEILKEYDIEQAIHMGTYNCRKIGGTNLLSQHGYAMAIDFYGLRGKFGSDYIIEDHWEHNTENPTTNKGQVLYEFARRLYDEQIFNVVLTPNHNAAHDDHLHVDLASSYEMFDYGFPGRYWMGNDRHLCPGPEGTAEYFPEPDEFEKQISK